MNLRPVVHWVGSRRASVAVESAISIAVLTMGLASLSEVVKDRMTEDLLERAAYAVTNSTILATEPASSEEELHERARRAIQSELGRKLDTDLLQIDIDSYNTACDMSRGIESVGEYAHLGGDSESLMIIRLSYMRPDGWVTNFIGEPAPLQKVALGRNEPRVENTG